MPEKIFVLYNYTDAEREQAQHMFLDAGLLDVVVTPHLLTGHHKLELRDDDAARRLRIAARLHGLREPHIQRILHPRRRFEFWRNDDEFYHAAAKAPRSNCVLDPSKLLATGVKLRSVEEALIDALRRWQPESEAQ